ncbi:hypothetical protein [Sphaerisporangium corydalis]|uniref:Septum formation initiator n=1 Tax=Sphaerisporangium corydalis TaxID=1441875 RepID=A0ABV9E5G6_9ACTN|nr:hypothetical protein [Sphaerisporangium corydalis]
MNRRPLLVVAGWLVVVLIATGAGIVVTAFLGETITGSAGRALSPADVRRSLDALPSPSRKETSPAGDGSDTPAPARPSATASPSTPPSGAGTTSGGRKVISARGGVVVARCDGGLVTAQSWTPAQGYEVKDAERGPRDKVRVRFESGGARTEIEVRCAGGRPVPSIKED